MENSTPTCFFCGSLTNDKCDNCIWAFHCSQHKQLHTDQNGNCFPYKVERVEGVGNCLVAGRDISPGETVLQDSAASISPSTPNLVCLECMSPVSPSSRCSSCNLPLCCSGPSHQMECDVMSEQPAGNELSSSLYLTVSVIRLLSLKKSDPERWKLVESLMDHLEERRKQPKWDKLVQDVKENIPRHSRDEVEQVVGILLTNSVSRPLRGVDWGQALFPVFSLSSHSCIANTWRCIEDDILTLRATVPVPTGTELTTSYKSPSIGSVSRRPHFPSAWFFDCSCPRCSSPTELGTFMSALRCPDCPGYLLPLAPLDYNSPWSCSACSRTMTAGEALDTTNMLHNILEKASGTVSSLEKIAIQLENLVHPNHYLLIQNVVLGLEKMAQHLDNVLHPNHYLLLQIKRDLAMLYGSAEGFALQEITEGQLANKIRYCQENLGVMEVVEPGYSRWRGRMLEQLAMGSMEVMRRRVEEGGMGKMEVMLEYKGVMKLIKQSGKCRHFETREEQDQFTQRVKNLLIN